MFNVSPGSIVGGFRLLAWLFPVRPLGELTDAAYEELCQRYKSRDFWGNWIGLLVFIGLAAIYFMLLLAFGRWMASDVPKEHFVGPLELLYVFGAIFLSLFSMGYILFGLYRLALGKQEFDLYIAYGGEKFRRSALAAPVDTSKVFRLFFWLFVPPLALLMLAYADHYASFTPQGILINSFWSLGMRVNHPYGDVAGVCEVQKVHLRNEDKLEPYQVILFKDGTRWETNRGSLEPLLQKQRDLMTLVADRSGKPLTVVNFDEDIPKK